MMPVERKVVHRRSFQKTGMFLFGIGALCTLAMIYTVNREDSLTHAPFVPLHDSYRDDIPNSFRFTPVTAGVLQEKVARDIPEMIPSAPISDLVRRIVLTNVTQPWFTPFPPDNHIQSFLSFFSRRNTTITSLPTTTSLDARINCSRDNTSLLIMVPSVVKDAQVRHVIRRTWAAGMYGSDFSQTDVAKIVFFFGDRNLKDDLKETLRSESQKFGDIVTLDMVDSYRNLSLKISTMLQWSSSRCPSAQFVAKVDADTWVNVPLMIKLLEALTTFTAQKNIQASVVGFRHAYNKPAAVHTGKWEIPASLYPYNFLPRYVYGHSYVLSRQAVHSVVTSLPFFPIIPNEDAFITGIMSLVSNVTRVHSPAFAHLFKKQSFRDVQYSRFVSSIYSKKNLKEIWRQLVFHNATDKLI